MSVFLPFSPCLLSLTRISTGVADWYCFSLLWGSELSFGGEDGKELPGDRGLGPHSNCGEALATSLCLSVPFGAPDGCNQGNAQAPAKSQSWNAVVSTIQFPTHSGKPRVFGLPHYWVSSWDKASKLDG